MNIKPIEPLILTESEIVKIAPSLPEIVQLVEDAYRMEGDGKAEVPAKIGVHPDHPNSFLHDMPAWVGGIPALGTKIVTYYPGNFDRGLNDSTALIIMYEPDTGQPVAIMEGMWITFARTVACAAVAARHLLGNEPRSLGLIGCGGLGGWTLRLMGETFATLREVRVASRRRETREAFCRSMAEEGDWNIEPVDRLEDAIVGLDLVVSSTPQQQEPRLKGEWWQPGTLAVPFDYPFAWDDAAYAATDWLVADSLQTLERFERQAAESGVRPGLKLPADRVLLQDIVRGKANRVMGPDDRVMAVVTGIASTDVAVAWEIYQRAVNARVGTRMRLN